MFFPDKFREQESEARFKAGPSLHLQLCGIRFRQMSLPTLVTQALAEVFPSAFLRRFMARHRIVTYDEKQIGDELKSDRIYED